MEIKSAHDHDTIVKNLKDLESVLQDSKDTNFVVFTYLAKYHNVQILVDGVEHHPGWLNTEITNVETIRVIWSKMRNFQA